MTLTTTLVNFTVASVAGVLNRELTERQIIIIYFSLQAMQKAHKRRPTFLQKRGITEEEIEELLVTLEAGDSKPDSVLPVPPNAYIF